MSESISNSEILIKYFLIGEIDTKKIITEYSTNLISFKEKKNANHIFQKICKSNEKRFEERNIISANDNKYYFTLFQPNIVFITFAKETYPEKLIFSLFDEIIQDKILTLINEETKELNPNGRQSLKKMIEKYQEKEIIDKYNNNGKDIVKAQFKQDINTMEKNTENIENLIVQSEDYNNTNIDTFSSIEYNNKIIWWKNMKIKVILITSAIVMFFIILCIIL